MKFAAIGYMENKLKIDPKKVEYDGHSFRLIIDNEEALLKKLKEKQSEIIKDLENDDESIILIETTLGELMDQELKNKDK